MSNLLQVCRTLIDPDSEPANAGEPATAFDLVTEALVLPAMEVCS